MRQSSQVSSGSASCQAADVRMKCSCVSARASLVCFSKRMQQVRRAAEPDQLMDMQWHKPEEALFNAVGDKAPAEVHAARICLGKGRASFYTCETLIH